jgi:hypothetical protein
MAGLVPAIHGFLVSVLPIPCMNRSTSFEARRKRRAPQDEDEGALQGAMRPECSAPASSS